jgi:hypothetical protein
MTILQEIEFREKQYLKEIYFLREENKRLRTEITENLISTIKHNDAMFCLVLESCLKEK